jgi:hypothetical protein
MNDYLITFRYEDERTIDTGVSIHGDYAYKADEIKITDRFEIRKYIAEKIKWNADPKLVIILNIIKMPI